MSSQVISFRCTMKSRLGEVLSFSYNEDVINQLGNGDPRLSALIEGLQSVKVGEKRRIRVPATRAYGIYDPSLSLRVNVKEFSPGKRLDIGSEIAYPHPTSGDEKIFRVVEKTPLWVRLEGNHPMAGLDLVFEVEIVSARDAMLDDVPEPTRVWLNQYIH